MKEKHTPGPWRMSDCGDWSASHDGYGATCYSGVKDQTGAVVAIAVAHDPEPFDSDPDPRANARLIAAAPDLLESLQYAIKQVPELGTVPGIRDAIAKATGAQP
jgi:hypothetical protein